MFLAAWIPDLWKERNKIIKDAIKKNISTWVFGYKSDKITWDMEATIPFLLALKVSDTGTTDLSTGATFFLLAIWNEHVLVERK